MGSESHTDRSYRCDSRPCQVCLLVLFQYNIGAAKDFAMAAVEVARVMAEAAQMVDEAWKELAGSGRLCFPVKVLLISLVSFHFKGESEGGTKSPSSFRAPALACQVEQHEHRSDRT